MSAKLQKLECKHGQRPEDCHTCSRPVRLAEELQRRRSNLQMCSACGKSCRRTLNVCPNCPENKTIRLAPEPQPVATTAPTLAPVASAATKPTTQPEYILRAARAFTAPFAREDLIVAAWKLAPRVFGLAGFEESYPDNHKILLVLMGAHGLVRAGRIVKLASGLYTAG